MRNLPDPQALHASNHSQVDRLCQFGDGLFETMAVVNACVPDIELHLQRLQNSAQRLDIFLDLDVLQECLQDFLARMDEGVCKVLLARGGEGRGYMPTESSGSGHFGWITAAARPEPWCINPGDGIKLGVAETPVSTNRKLAGMKHCSRLEQVLAARELQQSDCQELLMLDEEANVIEGARSNVFVYKGARWYTPMLDKAGIAGIVRAKILTWSGAGEVLEARLKKDDVLSADAVFVCNSLQGVVPVAEFSSRKYPPPGDELLRLVSSFPYPWSLA